MRLHVHMMHRVQALPHGMLWGRGRDVLCITRAKPVIHARITFRKKPKQSFFHIVLGSFESENTQKESGI